MDSSSASCLSTVMILFSALMMYLTRRTVEKRLHTQQAQLQAAHQQQAQERYDAMLVVLAWVHKVHQAVYFAEVTAQRVLPEKPDNSGWAEVASRLDALGPCPPESSLLPESLRSMLVMIEPELADIRSCVARHTEALALLPYGTPSLSMLSEQELGAARKALAQDLEEKTRAFNIFMEKLEKHFDAAFFGPLDVRLHRGRNDPALSSSPGSASKEADDKHS